MHASKKSFLETFGYPHVYPERLKYAVIKPVYKKGEKAVISNYRPISIVTGFAKVFEPAIFRRLSDHIIKYKILHSEQYGFQKRLSTEDAVFKLTCGVLVGVITSTTAHSFGNICWS